MARPGLTRHRKFLRLVRSVGNVPLALGCLELLWEKCYENGDDYLGDAVDVEGAAQWPGEPGFLMNALLIAGGGGMAGFVEEIEDRPDFYRVHDLFENAPEYVQKRMMRELARKQRGKTISDLRREAGKKGHAAQLAQQTAANGGQTADSCPANGGHLPANGEHLPANGGQTAILPLPLPHPGGKEAKTNAPNLPASQLARGILETIGLPVMPTNLRAVTAAIESVATTRSLTIPEAYGWLDQKVSQAKKAGQVINSFWFQDARYNEGASALPVEYLNSGMVDD